MKNEFKAGIGLDCGTGFLVSARSKQDGETQLKSVRDCFLEIITPNKLVQSTMRKGLIKSGISFLEDEDSIIILGQDSLQQSVERQAVLKRPMSKGVISPKEAKALPMFKALLKELLGAPKVENEKIVFTVPAPPVDGQFDVIYHTAVIESILKDLGFAGKSINEAHALAFSELENDDYSGISISFGSGMTNVAAVNAADLLFSFSIAKGGDYIDHGTATSLGFDSTSKSNAYTPNLITFTKEAGVDILNPDPNDKIQIGIAAHYRNLIKYLISNLVDQFSNHQTSVKFVKPVPIVIAGGTSLAKGFIEVFNSELKLVENKLPFKVKEVRHSKNALESVAQGCLIALMSEE